MEQELDVGLKKVKLQAVDVQKEMLVLRLAMGKLRATAQSAFAPITVPLLEGLQGAVHWAARLVNDLGIVLSAVTGLGKGQEGYTKSVTKSVKALRRAVAGFDQLNRLGTPRSGQVTTQVQVAPETFQVPEHLQGIVDGILQLLAPLREIDLTPVQWHFARLTDQVKLLWEQVKVGLVFVWEQMLVPFAQWLIEEFVPTALFCLQKAVELLITVLPPLAEGFSLIWQAMQPVFRFVGECLLVAIDQLRRLFVSLADTFEEKSGDIRQAFETVHATIEHIWSVLGPLLWTMKIEVCQGFSQVRELICQGVAQLADAFGGLADFLLGVFTSDWGKAWEGLKTLVKNAVNGILSLVNGMLTGLTAGLNGAINLLNKLKISIPDWVPGYGGKTFSLSLPTLKTPKVPYLAQGAVLPANKPFLAMVGDQKHGTNVEAPLATIQEAVAQVMGDMLPAMVAGFERTTDLQNRILGAVLGIQIGDETLATAVNRYNQKMELVRGG